MPTNANVKRAARAEAAIAGYRAAQGDTAREDDEDPRTRIIDLVTDLHHLADARNIDWDDVIFITAEHHQAETEQPEPGQG